MIEFHHLYKTYSGHRHALKDVTLTIGKGEFVFLTGPSGAGKTTLFKMISAFDKPTSGNLTVGKFDVADLTLQQIPYFRRSIGVVFQDFRLMKDRTLFENVALPLEVKNERREFIDKRVRDTLDLVGLAHRAKEFPEMVSGGEQQRAAIARALIHKPGVLIADEPTGNLDPHLTEEIMNLFENVSNQGTTVFIATHDHALVERRKKRRISIEAGRIMSDSR